MESHHVLTPSHKKFQVVPREWNMEHGASSQTSVPCERGAPNDERIYQL